MSKSKNEQIYSSRMLSDTSGRVPSDHADELLAKEALAKYQQDNMHTGVMLRMLEEFSGRVPQKKSNQLTVDDQSETSFNSTTRKSTTLFEEEKVPNHLKKSVKFQDKSPQSETSEKDECACTLY
jgi:hypothetical protein